MVVVVQPLQARLQRVQLGARVGGGLLGRARRGHRTRALCIQSRPTKMYILFTFLLPK